MGQEFSRRQTRAILLIIPIFLLIMLFAFNRDAPFLGVPSIAWVGLFAIVLIASFRNWSCPNCGEFLGGRGSSFSPKACRHCGIPLKGE